MSNVHLRPIRRVIFTLFLMPPGQFEQPCPCYVVCDSLACMHFCPTGALKLVAIAAIHMGTIPDPDVA